MNTSDSAEEFVKLYLDGVEHCIKIAGVGAKNIAIMLLAMSKEAKQTKGKTRLTNMLKTGKPLTIFTIKAEDLKKFSQEAKRYGVLYCALANKKNSKIDGMVDIMVKEEDAARLNRIAKRFNFKDVATVKTEYEKEREKEEKNKQEEMQQENTQLSEGEQFIEDIMPVSKKEEKETPSNNTKEAVEKNQSEIFSNIKLEDKVKNFNEEKKSVKIELKEAEIEAREKELERHKEKVIGEKDNNSNPKHMKEKNNSKKTGKHFKQAKHYDNSKKVKKNKGRGK